MPLKKIESNNVNQASSQSSGHAIEVDGDESTASVYDEIVVTQENQILPAFIVQFDPVDQRRLFASYRTELYEWKNRTDQSSASGDIQATLGESIEPYLAPRFVFESDNDSIASGSGDLSRFASRYDLESNELSQFGDSSTPLLRIREFRRIDDDEI